MKNKSILIEKAANEFNELTGPRERGNKYSKDRNHRKRVVIASKIAGQFGLKQEFFVELVASKNF